MKLDGAGARGARAALLVAACVLLCCVCAVAAPSAARADEGGSRGVGMDEAGARGEAEVPVGEVGTLHFSEFLERVEVTSEGSARFEGVPFGLSGFERLAKGTARAADGAPEGYRFPLSPEAGVVAIRTPENVLLHVDRDAVGSFDGPFSAERELALWSMVCALDERASMGGALLSTMEVPYRLVFDDSCTQGDYRYRFNARGADGSRYATVTLASAAEGDAGASAAHARGIDLGDGALWCDSAQMVAADGIVVEAERGPIDQAARLLASIDFRPFWVSLKTSGLALAISFVLGLLAAWRVMGASSRLKGLLDSVFTIPMVLPPTVCGFLLLMLFGNSTAVGRWLIGHGISIVFTWQAAVIAAVVVSFPLVYRTALGAFESLDAAMLDAARTLGWSERRIFRKIMLPLAWPSIAAGTVLAFARAMGEFGCTLFFAGNYAGVTQTIPIAIYFEWMGGNTSVALFWVVAVIAFSFLVVWGINAYTARNQGRRSGACVCGASRRAVASSRDEVREGVAARRSSGGLGGRAGGTYRPWRGRVGRAARGVSPAPDALAVRDGLEDTGGDALCIDREALRSLFEDGAS